MPRFYNHNAFIWNDQWKFMVNKGKVAVKVLGWPKILAIIGGLIMVIQGIISIIGGNLLAIIGIILGLVVLISTGVIKAAAVIPFNKIVVLILGIIGLFVGTWLGAIFVIIAAILLFMGK